jgi:ferredoxin
MKTSRPDRTKNNVAYQKEFVNRLARPEGKLGTVYSILDQESILIGGSEFLPTWDKTDHLHFACGGCNHVADILQVFLTRDGLFTLFFWLGCPNCGATGQRKIYLDRRNCAARFQCALAPGELLIYSDKRSPARVIPYGPVRSTSKEQNQTEEKVPES